MKDRTLPALDYRNRSSQSPILPPNQQPRQQDGRNRHNEEAETYNIGLMISRSENSTVNVWTDNTAKLSTSVRQADADTSCYCAVEGSDSFWPDDWVSRSCAGRGDDEAEIFDCCVGDGDKKDVADYDGGFDFGSQRVDGNGERGGRIY
jgi:hypothetical protein